jgi:trimeric autotransporter adhesin
MQKIYTTLVFCLIVCSQLFAEEKTTDNPAIIITSLSSTNFCPGQMGTISFTSTITMATTYAVQVSDFDGTFGSNPNILGTGISSPMNFILPTFDSETGNLYKLRIINTQNSVQVSLPSPVIFFTQLTTSVQNVFGSTTIDFCQGSAVKLYAKLNKVDNNDVTYRWDKDGSRIIGANTSTYIATQGGSYSVYAYKLGCGSNSQAPTTYVDDTRTSIGGIGEDYETESMYQCQGSTIKLKALNHSEYVSYTWKKDGVIIPNETNGYLNVTQSGVYSLKTSDLKCSNNNNSYIYSKEFIFGNIVPSLISVYGYGTEMDTIYNCPNKTNKMFFAFNSSVSKKENFIYDFQWKKDGENIEGAVKDNFITSSTGTYSLKVTQGNCSTTSKLLILKPQNSIPSINIRGTTNICAGVTPTLLYVDYASTCGILQWQKNQIDIPSATYTGYLPSETGSYRLKISQGSNVNFTNAVTITVGMSPTYKITSLYDTISCTTQGFCYLDIEGLYNFPGATFQWYKNGDVMPNQTANQLNTYSEGAYKLKVSVGSCEGFSNQINLIKRDYLTKPKIFSYNGKMLCNNAFTTLVAIGNYSSTQWKRNGINISSINNFIDITESGNYTVSIIQGTCTAESDPIKINVGDKQQSIKTADWSNPVTWSCGTIPTVAEDVLINKTHTVSLPNGYTGWKYYSWYKCTIEVFTELI